jgi:hypothetical protein
MTDVAAAAAAGDLSFLDETALHDWVVAQRWFGSKAREVTHIDVAEAVPLRTETPILVLALIEARFGEGTHETYQLALGLRPAGEGWTDRVTRPRGASCCTASARATTSRWRRARCASAGPRTRRPARRARSTCGRSGWSSPTRRWCSARS